MTQPEIIAHRGGKQNWPENTICAFRQNVAQGIGTIELDVQVTQDGQVVVYHPDDLSQWTNASGAISSKPAAEITELNTAVKYAGPDTYKTACSAEDTEIPLLANILHDFPQTQFVVDMKSPETQRLVDALVTTIPAADWPRLRFYSTNPEHTKLLRQARPNATIFEDRGETLTRLLTSNETHQCVGQGAESWIAYELVRPLQVCDKTKLGSTCVEIPFTLWSDESVVCTRASTHGAGIVFFGINTAEDYRRASELGADAVFSDNPSLLVTAK
jgi:glycerophosphoryl diester phosphodiesterase